ncbi:MAG: hypothetical protein WBO00_09855 [Steroidobacteraceae bacterium]
MLGQLLPRHFDNDYRGSKLAPWLFGAVVLVKLGISLGTIFNGHEAASSADGIPLDTFGPAGAQTVISLFAIWGLAQFVICLLCALALVRYRSMIPLLFALLLLEYLAKRVILHFLPVATTGTPPGSIINLVLLGAMIIGLTLSLRIRAISE